MHGKGVVSSSRDRAHRHRRHLVALRLRPRAHCIPHGAPRAFQSPPIARCTHTVVLRIQWGTRAAARGRIFSHADMAGWHFTIEDRADPSRAGGGRRPRRDLASSLARGQADLLGRAGKVTRAAPVRAPSRWQVTRNRGRARLQRAGPCFRANRRVLLGVQGLCGSHRCARGCSCVRVCVLLMRDGGDCPRVRV